MNVKVEPMKIEPAPAPSCGNCRFYQPGACMRRPPVSVQFHDRDGDLCSSWQWPSVRADDWCGEHEAAP